MPRPSPSSVAPTLEGRGHPNRRVRLDVHGLRIAVEGEWPEVVDALASDFAWFQDASAGAGPDVTVSLWRRTPDPERFGRVPQAFVTTRNVVFQRGHQTIVDYSGRALAVYDRERETLLVESQEEHLAHEAAYLFLLSRIGRHLDRRGMTRVHALGLSGNQGAVMVLLPSGGGKTTLALRALREPGVKLLSEDTPVLDHHGRVHPFPLRIGVNEIDAPLLLDGEVRRIERLEYGPKLVLGVPAFADRIETQPQPLRHLVIGRRWLGGEADLHRVSQRAVANRLLRDGVVGVGVAQMIEYILMTGVRDLLRQGGVAISRTHSCLRGLMSAEAWQLELARDTEQNWAAVRTLLD